MATVNFYSKEQTDALLPDADDLIPDFSGASIGDVLTINNYGSPAWEAIGGSGGEGWEDIDPLNLPSDLSEDDIILIDIAKLTGGIPVVNNWTSSISSSGFTPGIGVQPAREFMMIGHPGQINFTGYMNLGCVSLGRIVIETLDHWTSTVSPYILGLYWLVFNGSYNVYNFKTLTPQEMSDGLANGNIRAFKRLKSS